MNIAKKNNTGHDYNDFALGDDMWDNNDSNDSNDNNDNNMENNNSNRVGLIKATRSVPFFTVGKVKTSLIVTSSNTRAVDFFWSRGKIQCVAFTSRVW